MTDDASGAPAVLATSPNVKVTLSPDGALNLLVGPIVLRLDRLVCEELTTTLARAMVALWRAKPRGGHPPLELLQGGGVKVRSP